MGYISISSHPSASSSNAQTTMVPTHTSEVNSVQSMQPKNPQQLGGKRRGIKRKIPTPTKGLLPHKTIKGGGGGGHKR
jgi:hypothetical protein